MSGPPTGILMARGWESKAVESQIEASRTNQGESTKMRLAPEAAEAHRKRETLLLACHHLQHQIQASLHPRHREMLESALADLERQIAALDGRSKSASGA